MMLRGIFLLRLAQSAFTLMQLYNYDGFLARMPKEFCTFAGIRASCTVYSYRAKQA